MAKQGMENTSTTILTWRRIKIIKHVPVLMQTIPMEWNFTLFNIVDGNNKPLGYYYARVVYILPNSPAHAAGLERGDWIIGIDGKNNIKRRKLQALLNGSASQWIIKHNSETKTIAIGAFTAVEDNPLYYHDVLTFGDKKIGYLVYNHFTHRANGRR